MRGEDGFESRIQNVEKGSPPHARGRLVRRSTFECKTRITPACAGKTFVLILYRHLPSDHPRMRGEDCYSILPTVYIRGSPPHARGRRDNAYVTLDIKRITPACAGKTKGSSL